MPIEQMPNDLLRAATMLGILSDQLRRIRLLVDRQATDEGLWFVAETVTEAYLQQELRRLHATIEGRTAQECADSVLEGADEG